MADWDAISTPAHDWDAVSEPAQTKRSAARKPQKRTWVDNVAGLAANYNRGTGVLDELSAAGSVVEGLVTGRHRFGNDKSGNIFANNAAMLRDAYNNELAGVRNTEDSFSAAHPNVAALARGFGMASTVAIPTGGQANIFNQAVRIPTTVAGRAVPAVVAGRQIPQVAVNAARGAGLAATQAGAYAAVDRGTIGERGAAAGRAMVDPATLALGAGGGALATRRKLPTPKPAKAPTSGDILADIGVSSTIPQRMGRSAKGIEDLGKRAPILGPAQIGYQERQLGQLNRGVGLKALEPVGIGIPKEIKPGFEMVEYVDKKLGDVYDEAANMTPVVRMDDTLLSEAETIGAKVADLTESEQRLWASSLKDKLTRLSSGEVTGKMVKQIQSEVRGLRAEHAKKGNDTLAGMYGELERAIIGTVARANPQAASLIAKADEGWKVYSMMNDAARAASAKGGVFLPGHLNTQVRRAADRMGSNMAGKGKGPLQDIATAASEIIPDSYGNPGTANAIGLGGAGVGLMTEPVTTLAVGAGLAAAATPYMLAGRKVLETLPPTASRAQLAEAARKLAELASRDPEVAALQREVAARLSRAAGVAGGARASGQSAPNIYAQP